MSGPEWDEPKQLEIAKFERLKAKCDIAADEPCPLDQPPQARRGDVDWVSQAPHRRVHEEAQLTVCGPW